MSKKTAIVLAAGLGTRMKSARPKVLHETAGVSMISRVVSHLQKAGVQEIRVVVGFGAEQVEQALSTFSGVKFFKQQKQKGTGDAVKSAQVDSLTGTVMICNGDHPLITDEDYAEAWAGFEGQDLVVVSATVKNPAGFGRIVRGASGDLLRIVEEKDASAQEKKISEINTGLYVAKAEVLKKYIPLIKNNNAKGEFYLTDIITMTIQDKLKTKAVKAKRARVARGVNNKWELAQAGKVLFVRKAKELMEDGVTIIDPTTTYIETSVKVGKETVIEPGCMIKGKTIIGEGVTIEGHCQIVDSVIADGAHIKWGTLIDKSEVGKKALVGPYARLRPETKLEEEVHIGNFVELKKTVMGARAKANHLTYLGDAEIGEETNIGCGTITCNYAVDRKKYKTKIGKKVFVGSDTQFIAPIEIGDGAVIGSGSTITKDVPARALAVTRAKQLNRENYNKE